VAARFRVALTFDAEHPDRAHRPRRTDVTDGLLDVLGERGAASTWFLQGRWVEAEPELARRVANEGHLVGNHSFYHARLPLLTDDGLATDIRAAEEVIREMTKADPRPWFRCPFAAGADDPRVLRVLARLGYRDIGADVILDDWEPDRTGPAILVDALRLAGAVGDGAVILFHAWPGGTLDALPELIDGLRERGAELVRIDELERFSGEAPTTAAAVVPAEDADASNARHVVEG
jgi:peptidoglycan/xylan/chitin deacetylase (PgdA/CDA1 family)